MSTLEGDDDEIPHLSDNLINVPGLEQLQFTQEEVVKAINSMKTNSATGYDGVSYMALKMTSESTKNVYVNCLTPA